MDIAPTSIAQSQVQNSTAQSTSASDITTDFETFLRMMTAQLENQDPLNPIESSDYAVQLATFSSVEQQVQTNELLQELISASSGSALSDYAGWVGMDALAATPAAYSGDPITVVTPVPAEADAASFVVKDAAGLDVLRIAITPDTKEMVWNGTDSSGATVPHGTYAFWVESASGSTPLLPQPGAVYSRITEAQVDNGAVSFVLSGGAEISPDDVQSIRESGGS